MRKYNNYSKSYVNRTGCQSPNYYHHGHPSIYNSNNPIITIFNNVSCRGSNGDDSPREAAIMGYDEGEFDGIGNEYELIGLIEMLPISDDPLLVSATVNWMVSELPLARAGLAASPQAQFKVTRQALLPPENNLAEPNPEVTIYEAAAAAPEILAPSVTHLQILDALAPLSPEGLSAPVGALEDNTMIYRIYIKVNEFGQVVESTAPFSFMVRQYPVQ